jgi:hypothetical protein
MRSYFIAISLALSAPAFAQEKVTYQDHVRPIFAASCLSCHNPDKAKAGLDLSTYGAMMNGSSNGKVITPGSPDESMLYLLVTFQEEPHMPQKANKLPDAQLETIKKWIAGGALEAGGSVAVAAKPKVEMKLTAVPTAKPQGAPPMPKELSLDPIVRADRAAGPGAMAASPWAPLVAFSSPHQILLYDVKTTQLLGVLPFPEGLAKTLRFSRNGSVLLAGGGVGGQSGRVALYDVVSGRRVAQVGEEFDEVLAADISPDQSMVALGGPGKKVKIYPTTGGKALHEMTAHTDWVTAVAFSPDGVLLASGDRSGGLRVWESSSGNEFYTLNGHKAGITSLSFRADSNVLASASEDGTVKLWDMNSGKSIKSIPANSGGVLSVDFATDGKLVSAGRDRIVRIWNSSGTKLRDLPPAKDIALHAVFADQGKLVVCDDFTGAVRVSNVADAKQLAELDVNPPTIAERLAIARKHAADSEALAARSNDALKSAENLLAKAQADLTAAQAGIGELKKKADAAQANATAVDNAAKSAAALLDPATKALGAKQAEREQLAQLAKQAHAAVAGLATAAVPTTQAATQPVENPALAKAKADAKAADDRLAQADAAAKAAQQDLDAKRAASAKAASDSAAAVDTAKAARALLASAEGAVQAKSASAKSAAETLAKAKAAEDDAREKALSANADLLKWKQAEVTNSIAQTRREFDDLSARAAKMTDALAQIESATKAISEGPQRIAAAQAKQVQAKAVVNAALASAQHSQQGVIALEAAAVRFDSAVKPLRSIHPFVPMLHIQVRNALQQIDAANAAVAQSAAASDEANKALALAQAEQQQAPKVIADAKQIISGSLADRIEAAKAKLEALAQQARVLSVSR